MRDVVIVDAVRTPVGKGKPGGGLSDVHPVDLHAHALRTLVERTGVDPALLDDVIGGVVGQVGEQSINTTRYAALAAGFPESVPATTVDRQCGSSQQAISFAAQGIKAGDYDLVIASGVESMSRIPIGSQTIGQDPFGTDLGKRYPEGLVPQGIAAELIAAKWGFTRTQLDELAVTSHQRAAAADFSRELAPVNGLTRDESIRPGTNVETLAGLKPAFYDPSWEQRFPQLGWHVTAGNSSPTNDGSAAVLLAGADTAERLGLKPRARIHTLAVTGDDPLYMLTGVIPATEKVLAKSGLRLEDIDAFEVNEAFASVVLAWQAEFGVDLAKVNRHGGAMAIGHPLGASGARIFTTLLGVLEETGGRYGLQTMCEAGGLANATIIERL